MPNISEIVFMLGEIEVEQYCQECATTVSRPLPEMELPICDHYPEDLLVTALATPEALHEATRAYTHESLTRVARRFRSLLEATGEATRAVRRLRSSLEATDEAS